MVPSAATVQWSRLFMVAVLETHALLRACEFSGQDVSINVNVVANHGF